LRLGDTINITSYQVIRLSFHGGMA